ncbi:MAG: pro-sigmaK processing inhibitor BofA family protein [Bacilli bacterium]|nr:pro-sigmaK processing inhibitor BofA family protein [Bacilli bacterium]
MFNKLVFFIRRIIFSMFIIYAYNSLAISFDMVIPINLINVALIYVFGVMAMFELIIFSFFC